MFRNKQFLALCLCFCAGLFAIQLSAQGDPIKLNNKSFQDEAHVGSAEYNRGPLGWYDCGAERETPPDIHPNPQIDFGAPGFFEVTMKGQDKGTYLGMVVRDNDTQEAVGQRLTAPLETGKCYKMTMYLARSARYVSQSRIDSTEANYTDPIKIRVYGGNSPCQKAELLDETPLVKNTAWKQYTLNFKPTTNHSFIVIQAFYKTPSIFPYNGNILVDNMSDIIPVGCDDDEPIAAVTPPEKKEEPKVNQKPKVEPTPDPSPPVVQAPPKKKNRIIKELNNDDVDYGQVIKLQKLLFGIDQAEINVESHEELDEISDFLSTHPGVKIEIHGHTNNRCDDSYCNKLSKDRAESVANYLIAKGIAASRITALGFGKTKPIASNRYSAGRKKNQRVEIKLLKI